MRGFGATCVGARRIARPGAVLTSANALLPAFGQMTGGKPNGPPMLRSKASLNACSSSAVVLRSDVPSPSVAASNPSSIRFRPLRKMAGSPGSQSVIAICFSAILSVVVTREDLRGEDRCRYRRRSRRHWSPFADMIVRHSIIRHTTLSLPTKAGRKITFLPDNPPTLTPAPPPGQAPIR